MSQIPIEKQVFDKDQFGKVIDTEFTQLINQQTEIPSPTFTLEDFFTLYNQLFYDISPTGETNSHEFLVQQSGEYINFEANSFAASNRFGLKSFASILDEMSSAITISIPSVLTSL